MQRQARVQLNVHTRMHGRKRVCRFHYVRVTEQARRARERESGSQKEREPEARGKGGWCESGGATTREATRRERERDQCTARDIVRRDKRRENTDGTCPQSGKSPFAHKPGTPNKSHSAQENSSSRRPRQRPRRRQRRVLSRVPHCSIAARESHARRSTSAGRESGVCP